MQANPRGHFRPVDVLDYSRIAENIRSGDADELSAVHGDDVSVAKLLRFAVLISAHADVFVSNRTGNPVAMRGVAVDAAGGGVPWLIGTTEAASFAREFILEGRKYVKALQERYGYLHNFVDARNTLSIRWLQKIGFTLDAARPHGQSGLPFHYFHVGARDVQP